MVGASSCIADHKLLQWQPCLCLDSMSSSGLNPARENVALPHFYKDTKKIRQLKKLRPIGALSSSFLDSWNGRRIAANVCSRKKHKQIKRLTVVNEVGGQYEYTFNDVKTALIDYFTRKAVGTVLEQLYEMNPPQYTWFTNYVAENEPKNGTRFLQKLVKERRELAERVMITRLNLYSKWIKICDHGEIYKDISEENLKLMRDRLMETIIWPSDDNATPDQ